MKRECQNKLGRYVRSDEAVMCLIHDNTAASWVIAIGGDSMTMRRPAMRFDWKNGGVCAVTSLNAGKAFCIVYVGPYYLQSLLPLTRDFSFRCITMKHAHANSSECNWCVQSHRTGAFCIYCAAQWLAMLTWSFLTELHCHYDNTYGL